MTQKYTDYICLSSFDFINSLKIKQGLFCSRAKPFNMTSMSNEVSQKQRKILFLFIMGGAAKMDLWIFWLANTQYPKLL